MDILASLGQTIKSARLKSNLTQEELAAKADISTRFVMAIENEGRNLSFDVFSKLIRILEIPTEPIFYPETLCQSPEKDLLIRLIHKCDERSLTVVEATVRALLESQ